MEISFFKIPSMIAFHLGCSWGVISCIFVFFVDGAKLLRKKERISIFIIIFVAKIQSS